VPRIGMKNATSPGYNWLMSTNIPISVQTVIDHVGITNDQLIGKGGEGFVFDRSKDTVLKVYFLSTKQYLEELVVIQQRASNAHLPFGTPQILNIEECDGTFYTIERKLSGKQLDIVFPGLTSEQQNQVIRNYIEALEPLKTIKVDDLPYGQLVSLSDCVQANSWPDYLNNKLDQQLNKSQTVLNRDVVNFSDKVLLLKTKIKQLLKWPVEKHFVHTDYFLNNVLVNENLEICSVLDLSDHAVVGDHRLDIASICFLPLDDHISLSHLEYVRKLVTELQGEEVAPYLDIYAFFYAFYYSNLHESDPHSYLWCLDILNNESRWERLETIN
jgi:hypothetical protein